MKRILALALVALPLWSMAQDDMYFMPSKKQKNTEQAKVQRPATITFVTEPSTVDYKSNRQSDDAYNRRYSSGEWQTSGGGLPDDSLMTATIDSVYTDSRYDMDDPELDYRYSRRLVRFHSPRYHVSPYYWDVVYGYGAWDYLYDPYDPWYYHYGWSYGWSWGPWDCWYGGIWGWSRPYAWTYWGWGPGWHHHCHLAYAHHSYHSVPRSSRGALYGNRGGNIRTSALAHGRSGGIRGGALASTRQASQGYRGSFRSNATAGRGTSERRTSATRGGSYSNYSNSRSRTEGGAYRQSAAASERTTSASRGTYSNSRSSVSERSSSSERQSYSRSTYNSNSSSRSTYTPSSRSSSSYGGGSFGGGSFGGSRGGGSFGGGDSRGGGRR